MRPIALRLTAFGSYAGAEFVDFIRLAEHGLFVVSGPTGSGKVFEALFVDEGFGSLDPEALNEVIDALHELHATGRMIGVQRCVVSGERVGEAASAASGGQHRRADGSRGADHHEAMRGAGDGGVQQFTADERRAGGGKHHDDRGVFGTLTLVDGHRKRCLGCFDLRGCELVDGIGDTEGCADAVGAHDHDAGIAVGEVGARIVASDQQRASWVIACVRGRPEKP